MPRRDPGAPLTSQSPPSPTEPDRESADVPGSRPAASSRWFYGWNVVATVCLTNFTVVVFSNPILGVFAADLEAEFGWSRAEVAAAITIGSLTAALLSPSIGWVVDRFGGRWLIAGAGLVMALALAMLSGLQALWQFYLFYAIGRGLAVSAVYNVGIVALSNWFVQRRPMVIGIVSVAERAGMATLPVFAAVVISIAGDWRAGWAALAVVAVVFGVIPPALFIRRRPEDMGLRPDGEPTSADDDLPSADPDENDFTLHEAVATRAYWLMGIAIGLLMLTGGSINFHSIPFLVDQGLGRQAAASVVTVSAIFGAIGGLVGGYVAGQVSARWTMVVSLAVMAAGPLLLLQTESYPPAMAFAAVYGFSFGSTVVMNQALYADYFGRASLGVIRGSFAPVQLVLNAAGPFVTGLWVDRAGSYNLPFLVFSALLLTAAGLLMLAPVPKRQPTAG